MRGGSPPLLMAGGAVVLTLYNRGVWQRAWAALMGPDVPIPLPSVNTAGQSGTVSTPPFGGGSPPSGIPPVIGATALGRAEAAVSAGPAPDNTHDWLNWCLAWVRRVRANLTGSDPGGVYGLPTAQAACDASHLNSGAAPLGANVCFRGNHIGISNGNGTYTSVGIYHGGPVTLPYLNNPNYTGWFA